VSLKDAGSWFGEDELLATALTVVYTRSGQFMQRMSPSCYMARRLTSGFALSAYRIRPLVGRLEQRLGGRLAKRDATTPAAQRDLWGGPRNDF
jgi:hypothetical protein